MLFSKANFSRSGLLAIVPSSLTISHITAAGFNPANLDKSTDASVWPALTKTPPSLYLIGNMCPGF